MVIIFTTNGEKYACRIVGMPKDTLSIENRLVKFKNKKSRHKIISTFTNEGYEMKELNEILPNGFKYKILRCKTPPFQNDEAFKNIPIPENSYYLLGDNRDNAPDSRIFGTIQRDQLQGRVLSVYFGKNLTIINKSL